MSPIVFALRRPITVMVAVIGIAMGCALALRRMEVDVFPRLNLPVIYVCQPYGGMDPAQMEGLLTNYYEYHFLYISGIHHVESQNVQGTALMKLFFHSDTDMAQAMAETINYVNRSRAFMPPGTVSPFVMRFDTGSVPVGYLVLSSETRSLAEIQDLALFRVRPMFASLPGVSAPPPFGGNQRAIVVDVDPERLRAYHLSPDDVVAALSSGNAISPSGNVPIGDKYPMVPLNSIVHDIQDLGSIPLKTGALPAVYLRDIAIVRDSTDIPVCYALANGRRAIYLLATKRADASTLSVVGHVKAAVPKMQAVLPDDIHVSFEFDQTPYVTRAIQGLATEGALGAVLTGLMVLLFLRDWRSVLVVVLNIPLALAGAILGLWLTGNTINLMTLGGLALSVGILVDEATVEVENIHTQMIHTHEIARAVRLGNAQTAVPRLLAMLCILAVFIPSFFMEGAARGLFVPLSLAVGFSMLTSYLLSSTFVPVISVWLLRHVPQSAVCGVGVPPAPEKAGETPAPQGEFGGYPFFERLSQRYHNSLERLIAWRGAVIAGYLALSAAMIALAGGLVGLEIFPVVDRGEFRLRVRAPEGTRFERTEKYALDVLQAIEEKAGADNVALTLGYVGSIPSSYPVNAVFQWSRGPEEALLRIALKQGSGIRIEELKEELRRELHERLPELQLSFEPADIVNEVMSFGSPTPVEVAVNGPNLTDTRAHLEKLRGELATIDALRDLQVVQSLDYPTIDVRLDREKAGASGVTTSEVARSLVAATSSSRFVVPNFWPDPKTGIGYLVQVQIPQALMRSVDDVARVPVREHDQTQLLLRDVAQLSERTAPGEYDRYNMRRQLSLTANIYGRDLAAVAKQVSQAIARAGEPPKGVTVEVRGQIPPLWQMLRGLTTGFGLAVVVIFLLLAANYQSWRLALVTVSATPAVVAGVGLALAATGTTLNLQSFIGAIMAVGVAMANGILLVTFAEQRRHRQAEAKGRGDAATAAVEGAISRLRPILMTSLAMTAGMLPLAIGSGEGGEQSAALGRAVIGGLAAATAATLFVVPAVFAVVQRSATLNSASLDPDDPASALYTAEESNGAAPTRPRFATFLAISALLVGCAPRMTESARDSASNAAGQPAARVTTVRPHRREIVRRTQQPGQIEAFQQTPLYAKVPGYVKRFLVDIGDPVKGPYYDRSGKRTDRGQLLAELSVPELDEDLQKAKAVIAQAAAEIDQAKAAQRLARAATAMARAQLDQAQAMVDRAKAAREKWESEYQRVRQLSSRSVVNAKVVDEVKNDFAAAQAAYRDTEAKVEAAHAAIEQCEANVVKSAADVAAAEARAGVAAADHARTQALVEYTRLEAPYDGIVTERNIDVGHFVQPAEARQSRPLFAVVDTATVRVFVDVPETDATLVDRGDRAVVRVPSLPGKEFAGEVTRTSWALASATRTLRTEIDVPNPNGDLRPGMYAYATIVLDRRASALTLPLTAIETNAGQAFCLCIAGGKVVRKAIGLGLSDGAEVEIVSGLTGDEDVVEKNLAALAEGQAAIAVKAAEQ